MFFVAADFNQFRPVAGGSIMRRLCEALPQVQLRTIFRSKDPELLSFLVKACKPQPSKPESLSFFKGRHITCDLPPAVARGLAWMKHSGRYFSWLCVTNAGADKMN